MLLEAKSRVHGSHQRRRRTASGGGNALPASLDAFDLLNAKPNDTFTAGSPDVWLSLKGADCQFEQATGSNKMAANVTDNALDAAGDDTMHGDAEARALTTAMDSFTTVWVGKFSDTSAHGLWYFTDNGEKWVGVSAHEAAGYMTVWDRRDASSYRFARKDSGIEANKLYCVITRHTRNGPLVLNINALTKITAGSNLADVAGSSLSSAIHGPAVGRMYGPANGISYYLRGQVRMFGVKKGTVLTDGEVDTLRTDIATYLGVSFT